jgi:hypothetical protein
MQVSKCMVLVTLGNPLTLQFFKCLPKFFGALLLCPLLKGQTNEVQLCSTVLIRDRCLTFACSPSWAIEPKLLTEEMSSAVKPRPLSPIGEVRIQAVRPRVRRKARVQTRVRSGKAFT